MHRYISAVLLMASAAVAAPSGGSSGSPSSSYYSLPQTAGFDNDVNGIPFVAVAPIGIYQDIYWQGMSLAITTLNGIVPGIPPNTPSNYAAYAKGDVATILQGSPAMRTNYPASTIDYFDLEGFYYGCAPGTEQSLADVAIPCTVFVTGYKKDKNGQEQPYATQSFEFKPSGGLISQMAYAKLDPSKFSGLSSAAFRTSYQLTDTDLLGLGKLLGVVADAIGATVIDTVKYKVYSKKSFSK